jgi:alpha-N-arabinofuranosidase
MADKDGLLITRRGALEGSLALGLYTAAGPARGATSPGLAAAVDVGNTGHPLSPYLFGGFIEHIGNLINHSLWSEVLDDRKFFHPVDSTPPPPAQGRFGNAIMGNQKWVPIGPDSAVTMNTTAPYVGEHSPVVQLAGSAPRGIAQSGLSLAKGKDYTGRIVVAGDAGSNVTATLIWGKGRHERQTVRVAVTKDWATVPIRFACRADTPEGRIEIAGTGTGSFRVGSVSLMPADNVHGFRADTVALMKEMNFKILRMPGGNFISGYDWQNTIGDPDKRPPIFDPVWKAVQPNDVGIDELMMLCREIDVVPEWCVNTGFGEPRSGAELVEYANGAPDTFWGAKRAANGHPEPWGIKYWNVGNEMYGHWQLGHMSLDQYTIKHNLFADAMRKVDPSIYIIVPGGFVDEMTTGQGIVSDSGSPLVQYGSDRDWAGGMLKNCWGKFDALATHAYPPENKHFDLSTGKNVDIQQTLVEWASAMAQRVATMSDCWQVYKQRFPALNEGTVKVFFDEWAYHFKQDRKSCLAIARAFHEFFRHSDFIDMAAYTMATAWLDFDRTHSVISASGRVFQLYNRHFGRIPVAVTGTSPVPPPQYLIGGDQPKVNTGSPTYPLDLSAALTEDSKALVIAIVNATDAWHSVAIALDGFKAAASGLTWKLTGSSLDAQNLVGKAPQIAIAEDMFDAGAAMLTVAPYGIELYEYRAA